MLLLAESGPAYQGSAATAATPTGAESPRRGRVRGPC